MGDHFMAKYDEVRFDEYIPEYRFHIFGVEAQGGVEGWVSHFLPRTLIVTQETHPINPMIT